MNIVQLMSICESMNTQPERFEDLFLDEAYFGTKRVQSIQDAMDKIVAKVTSDKDVVIEGSALDRELESAVKETFGFKSVHIYWANRAGAGMTGPYTMPGAIILHSGGTISGSKTANLAYGSYENSKDGFYDKNHELSAFIQMDTSLIYEFNMTSEELVAVLLHEIGHNFDYSPFTVIGAWYTVLMNLIAGDFGVLLNIPIQEWGRPVLMALRNLDTYMQMYIPPLGVIAKLIGRVSFNVSRFLTGILSPVSTIFTAPIYILYSPFSWFQNTFARKKEMYADSFAASYGYGSELVTALDKIADVMTGNPNAGPFMSFFYDFARLQNEIMALGMGGHTSNQRRAIKVINKLEEDMKNPAIRPEARAELNAKYQEMKNTYDKIVNMDEDGKNKLTAAFRRMVDNWYAGKPYLFIPSIGYDYAK